ncbi:MAG: hypothetical protein KDA37_14795, partial [Planctomycetales bacterium]|nr:hypothetical protein [Planctomycetales bacterium]
SAADATATQSTLVASSADSLSRIAFAPATRTLVLGPGNGGLVESSIRSDELQVERKSQLDLALALLHGDQEDDREDLEFVCDAGDEQEADEALAVALEDDLFLL